MKKLVFGIGIALVGLIIEADTCNSSKKPSTATAKVVQKALNGYDQDRALAMIDDFKVFKDSDISTKSISVWFSKEQINSMDTLLQNEAKINKADGIRIYFGCDPPLASTKLQVSMLIVSTKTRTPTGSLSAHEDYYNHTADFLSHGNFGDLSDDSFAPGALLNNPKQPCSSADDSCKKPSVHYIDCSKAYNWVQYHISKTPDKSAINTQSEWFSLCFIHSINMALQNVNNNLDGLRIYLGKGFVDSKRRVRDVFVLVPTYNSNGIHTDFYHCLEDLEENFCTDSLRARHEKYFFYSGYDQGELCPDKCN